MNRLTKDAEDMLEVMERTSARADIWQDRCVYAMAKAIYHILSYLNRNRIRILESEDFMDNNKVAGQIIKDLRTSVGITQADLGKRAGINQSRISLYESGKSEPKVGEFMKLISALGYMVVINRKV